MEMPNEAEQLDTDDPVSTPSPEPSDLLGLLSTASGRLQGLGDDFGHLVAQFDKLGERLAQGRFHLAVLGQFKRGKSTLLNALLGEAVLPTAVVPLTAIPTFIRPGETLAARVHFLDQREPQDAEAPTAGRLGEFLAGFVTETGNPKNAFGVAQVEVFHPAPLLARGVVLIDTPGIGSTFRHNTETTLNFLPQCDAALFLVSADPPITEVEVEFLRQVKSKVARLFFILNKVDYLSDDDRQAALEFLRKVLTEQAGLPADTSIFCVSARQGLEARAKDDEGLWTSSGMAPVERHLVEFLANEKAVALRTAVARQAAGTLGEALMRVRLEMRSLQMPLDELQQRLTTFEAKIEEAQRQRISAGDLLAGDRRRMHEFLEEHAGNLRQKAREYHVGVVQEALSRNGHAGEQDVQNALAEAIPGFFEHQVGQATELFRRRMADALRPHQHRADELIESVRKSAADLFDVPYHAPDSAAAFEMVHHPYWKTHKWSTTLNPIPTGLIDRLLPVSVQQKRLRKRLMGQVNELVVTNVENLRWAMFQSIDRTFIRFGSALESRFADTVEATQGAIRAAMERRQIHSEATAEEAAQLETVAAVLQQLRASLEAISQG